MFGFDLTLKSRLLTLLNEAERKLRALGNQPVWSSYESGPAIADFIAHARIQIQQGTITRDEKMELWGVFAPTSDWDDVIGDVQLGNEIFSTLVSVYPDDLPG